MSVRVLGEPPLSDEVDANVAYEDCGSMDKAVERARSLAQAGDTVLLAPEIGRAHV